MNSIAPDNQTARPRFDWRRPRPAPEQPGTLLEQFAALELFLSNPARHIDAAGSWRLARRLAIPHARGVHA